MIEDKVFRAAKPREKKDGCLLSCGATGRPRVSQACINVPICQTAGSLRQIWTMANCIYSCIYGG